MEEVERVQTAVEEAEKARIQAAIEEAERLVPVE